MRVRVRLPEATLDECSRSHALDRTRTPVFVEQMREIIFRPYWNIPSSIVRREILPDLAKDPGYLERHDMELVAGPSDQSPVVATNALNLAKLTAGRLRLRQRPGPDNSLGLIKFVFPNDEDVYLHATPAVALFARSRRDFSHGCVRVQDPVGLAEWALSHQGWTREAIETAMRAPSPTRVTLDRTVTVVLFYATAAVTSSDELLHFADDIYGYDRTLDRALTSYDHP